MALALADNEARWNPVELPTSLSKAGLPGAGRSNPTGTLARESVLEKQDECSIQGQRKFSKLIPHLLALERFNADKKKYLEEKAREIEREQRVSSCTGADGNAKDGTRQPVLLPPLMMGKMFFDRMKFYAMRSLDERSFLVDVMLHICNEKEQGVDELKNAIAVVKMVIGDFKIKLNQIEYIDEMTEEEMTLLDSSLERAWDNLLKRMESTRNFDEAATKPYNTEANWVCHAIGLKVDFLHRVDFDQIPQHWAEHLSVEEWICNFLGENYERENQQEPECVSRSSKETLEQMGFRSDVANTIVERASTMERHLPTFHWAELYVRDEIKYNPVLSGIIRHDKFPFFPYTREEWQVFPMEKVDGNNENYREVYVINLERRPNSSTSYPRQDGSCSFPQGLEDRTQKLLFHGTDHDSARDIFTHGVRVTQGRKNRDFSSGCGFYLTDDFEHAVEWAFCSTRKPAVLVYRVERSLLESFTGYSLIGEETRNEWVDLVKQYRSGKPTKKLRKSLRGYDFMEGPRSSSCDAISPEPKEGTYQMCVISSKLAEALDGRSLHSAVFYDA